MSGAATYGIELGDRFAPRVSFESVTLCIAAICQKEKRIVTVSSCGKKAGRWASV
jgi:hypothetical protein